VDNGHIFEMHWTEKSKKWLDWNPGIDIQEGQGWKANGKAADNQSLKQDPELEIETVTKKEMTTAETE